MLQVDHYLGASLDRFASLGHVDRDGPGAVVMGADIAGHVREQHARGVAAVVARHLLPLDLHGEFLAAPPDLLRGPLGAAREILADPAAMHDHVDEVLGVIDRAPVERVPFEIVGR